MSAEEQPLWLLILKAKYFPSSSPMFALPRGGSQFWKSLVKVRPVFQSFAKFVVGDGSSIRFWLDWWCGDSPLSVTFPTLFSYCSDPNISIAMLASQGWNLAFRRSLSPVEFEDWQRLTALFPTLSTVRDSVLWPLSASGRFSVKSLYSKLVGGAPTSRFSKVWKARIPPKIKIFFVASLSRPVAHG